MTNWEGAELCFYINGESISLPLSDTQFAIVGKILGLEMTGYRVNMFSDETLVKLTKMKGNPLRLVEVNHDER